MPLDIVLTASDADGDTLGYTVVAGPANGILTGSGGNLTYTPNGGFEGNDDFTFPADDGQGGTDTAVIAIQVKKPKGGGNGGGGVVVAAAARAKTSSVPSLPTLIGAPATLRRAPATFVGASAWHRRLG